MLSNCGLEKTVESPLDSKEIKPVNPKGNQSWIFIGRTDGKDEALIFWPPDAKSWLPERDPDAGKDCRQEDKGTTEDEMVGRHHWLNGHEFEQALGVGDGPGSLACCSPWGRKESDTTAGVNWLGCRLAAPLHSVQSFSHARLCDPHTSERQMKILRKTCALVVSHMKCCEIWAHDELQAQENKPPWSKIITTQHRVNLGYLLYNFRY